MSYRLRDKEPQTLHQAFMTTMDIENNLKYGLTRSHFSKVACLHNEDKNQGQYHVKCMNTDLNFNTPTVMYNQIEFSSQNVCVESNQPIANQDAYVCDTSAVDVKDNSLDKLCV